MNENTLEVIKNGLSIVTPAIQGIITTLLATLFLRKNTNIAEFEKLKAGKFSEVIDTLLESGKMTYLEFYKCHNFMKVAKLADKVTKDHKAQEKSENEFSFDWFMRFFDAVGVISNEEMHELWGQILANEIIKPKSCSLKTLDMVRNMSPEDARAFTLLCKYVMYSGDSYFIYPTGFYDEQEGYTECHDLMYRVGLSYSNSISPLLEVGILTSNHDLAFYFETDTKLQIHNEKILCIVKCENKKRTMFQQEAYFLTRSGLELYNIINSTLVHERDMEYALLCFKQMKKEHAEFIITAYEILEYRADEPYCDVIDLLA